MVDKLIHKTFLISMTGLSLGLRNSKFYSSRWLIQFSFISLESILVHLSGSVENKINGDA